MTEDEAVYLLALGLRYDAIPFLWVGRYGLQAVFMPDEVFRWRDAAHTRKPRRRTPSPRQRSLRRTMPRTR